MEESLPVITLVEKQKKQRSRYNIFLDHEYAFSVHEDLLIKYRLFKGENVKKLELETILWEDESHRAYLDAIRYLGRSPRSTKEIKLKLKQKGYESELIDGVLIKLVEQKYVDDEHFAKQWTEHRILFQKKGKNWVKQELVQKGLTKEQITGALNQVDDEAEYQCAVELATKKWNTLKGEQRDRKSKLVTFLLRRGFSNALVSRVFKQITLDTFDEFDEFSEDI